jgi:uncharacterized integral membrane protein (TIGR00698 family)
MPVRKKKKEYRMSTFTIKTRSLLPGLVLCALVTAAAAGLEDIERLVFGRAWLESLVLAILLGVCIRTGHRLHQRFQPGIQFGARFLLEAAVMLLGASVSARALLENGPALIGGIFVTVVLAIALSYAIGRGAGLPKKMAILIACGNAICGNSAIAAVAPVIDADGEEVAAAIAFTAVLGVAVVLLLPLGAMLLSFTPTEFGVFAGLTVYAVPQVLAATASAPALSLHVGTLVKLLRVLMLGPVVLALSVLGIGIGIGQGQGPRKLPLSQLVPWFIAGFLLMLALRSFGLLPPAMLAPLHDAAGLLTVMSMAALGLGVDARSVLQAGARVAATVVLSLAGLAAVSYLLIRLLGI